MENEKTLFYVNSEIQKMLMLHEIQGQMSDGMWENSNPYEHWKFWCSFTKDTIIVDSEKSGRTKNSTESNDTQKRYGYVRCIKDRYNLTDKDLLSVISSRMLFMSKLFLADKDTFIKLNYEIPKSVEEYRDYKEYAKQYSEENHYKKYIKIWDEAGYTEEYLEKIDKDETLFTMKDLRKELNGLKKAIMSKDMLKTQ